MITRSICPVCYKELPADVAIGAQVYMVKVCPDHGPFTGLVERDPAWYLKCREMGSGPFFSGHIVDVTSRCNMACTYCFHARGEDRPVDEVVEDAQNANIFPVYLSGGEPTLHPDLPEIVRRIRAFSSVWVVTNGMRLADEAYVDELCTAGLLDGSTINVTPSFHGETNNPCIEAFLERCRREKWHVANAYWVIDDLRKIDEPVEMMRKYRDVLGCMRIKAASNLWAEQKAANKIFVSDMLRCFFAKDNCRLRMDVQGNRTSEAYVEHQGMLFALVSWYDRFNVDLDDINCGPWYRAKNGEVHDLVYSCLINEGMGR
jgi:organic radical activating enzyme